MATKRTVVRAAASRMSVEDKKWRARDDLRTLQQASAIQADKSRVTAAQAQVKAIQAVVGKK